MLSESVILTDFDFWKETVDYIPLRTYYVHICYYNIFTYTVLHSIEYVIPQSIRS